MTYDLSNARDRAAGDSASSGTNGTPGKRAQTDRMSAPAGAAPLPGAKSTATMLAGTGWLEGVLGFAGQHSPTGECNCGACAAGRAAVGEGGEPGAANAEAHAAEGDDGDEGDEGGDDEGDDGGDAGDGGEGAEDGGDDGDDAAEAGRELAAADQAAGADPATDAEPRRARPAAADAAPGGPGPEAGPLGAGGGGGGAAATPKPTITSATQKAAPGGTAATRTTVAVGEVIDFTGSAAGTWSATKGTTAPVGAVAAFQWTAPAKAGSVTIKLTVGGKSAKKKIKVIAPNKLRMAVSSNDALTAGTAGVCMVTNVTIGPAHVSFGNVEWLEVPGPGTGVSGYFKKFSSATLFHNPNPSWLSWNDSNTGLTDHAAWHAVPGPYKKGGFRWKIPNRWRVAGTGAGGTKFTTTTQQFKMTNKAGRMTVSKAGASAARTP